MVLRSHPGRVALEIARYRAAESVSDENTTRIVLPSQIAAIFGNEEG